MDDILILAPSRWQLRRAIATMNGVLADLGLEQHPDKTTIGPVARGFDFLGYTYSAAGLVLLLALAWQRRRSAIIGSNCIGFMSNICEHAKVHLAHR